MKRRKFLKSILATALAAVVPFKVGSGEPEFKLPSYKGAYPKMRNNSIKTMYVDEIQGSSWLDCENSSPLEDIQRAANSIRNDGRINKV